MSRMCMSLCKVEVCFDLVGFARLFLVKLWGGRGHGVLFITPSLKTLSSLVDTADVQQNLYFFHLGHKEGGRP